MTEKVEERDIIQILPGQKWAGCLLIVKEVRAWGVVAYMQLPGPRDGVVVVVDTVQAFTRLSWDQFERTGGRVSS